MINIASRNNAGEMAVWKLSRIDLISQDAGDAELHPAATELVTEELGYKPGVVLVAVPGGRA